MNDYDELLYNGWLKNFSSYDHLVNWLSENHHEVFCQWAQVVYENEEEE